MTNTAAFEVIRRAHPHPMPVPFVPGIKTPPGVQLVFVSGTTAFPWDHSHPHVPEEFVPPEDIREQARRVFEKLRFVLEAAGASFRDVVRITKYLTNLDEHDAVVEVMREYFGDHLPTSTTVEVRRLVLPGYRLEIDLIAAVPVAPGA
jgi:2-iminobutanoate/2-iminopropanoate deaminase/2-aminomuconate deaminase